jgi:hypothetical protein
MVQQWQATDDNSIEETMRFAYWMTQAADTHSEYVIPIALPRQQLLRGSACILIIRMFTVLFITDINFYSVTLEAVSHKTVAADRRLGPAVLPILVS